MGHWIYKLYYGKNLSKNIILHEVIAPNVMTADKLFKEEFGFDVTKRNDISCYMEEWQPLSYVKDWVNGHFTSH